MSHKTVIEGTAHENTGGKSLVEGTVYNITKGRTLVGGTGYDIPFSKGITVAYTGNYDLYGTEEQGWIEMKTGGTLIVKGGLPCDLYLLGAGENGGPGEIWTEYFACGYGGDGGAGGKYKEWFGIVLEGEHTISIGPHSGKATTLDSYTSANGTSYAAGGKGTRTTHNKPTAGGIGRKPFTGKNPMSSGYAAKQLGAGGGGAGGYSDGVDVSAKGGTYGGGDGGCYNNFVGVMDGNDGYSYTGSGGGGGSAGINNNGSQAFSRFGSGGSGIAILRWGY